MIENSYISKTIYCKLPAGFFLLCTFKVCIFFFEGHSNWQRWINYIFFCIENFYLYIIYFDISKMFYVIDFPFLSSTYIYWKTNLLIKMKTCILLTRQSRSFSSILNHFRICFFFLVHSSICSKVYQLHLKRIWEGKSCWFNLLQNLLLVRIH